MYATPWHKRLWWNSISPVALPSLLDNNYAHGMPPRRKMLLEDFLRKNSKAKHTPTHSQFYKISGWQNYVPLRFHNLQGILFVIRRLGIVFSRNMPTTTVARHRYRFADPGRNLFAKLRKTTSEFRDFTTVSSRFPANQPTEIIAWNWDFFLDQAS